MITATNLGKRYVIGERQRYLALRDVLTGLLRAPLRSKTRTNGNDSKTLWALRDVSFEVGRGEVVGIVGRNGAGKSTLLKILSRVTRPSEGWAELRGRVGSLLEVGTGFHPELTGRENTFLSGAILGMSNREIEQKFDQIVAFAEVERFLDTPLKHYSSGMQMRLAFAVAAHLEPEILVIDEVLAVGDLEFQKKCLGKMSEVAGDGRTILFVSHQMGQIRRLCDRVIWLDRGQIRLSGATRDVIKAYEFASANTVEGDRESGICFLRWNTARGDHVITDDEPEITLTFTVRLEHPVMRGHFGVALLNEGDAVVAGWGFDEINISAGLNELRLRLQSLPLRPGVYGMTCSVFDGGNNLTGGRLIEQWYAMPQLVVDTRPVAHPQDRWAGVLNLPGELIVQKGE